MKAKLTAKVLENDNDIINQLVQALIYAKSLLENETGYSPDERAETLCHIDEMIYLHSARQTSEEQGMEDFGRDYWRLEK